MASEGSILVSMAEKAANRKVREATHAGIFYPDEPEDLARAVERLLQRAPNEACASPAILAPHASFAFSGDLAAAAWRSAEGRQVRRIVILAPVHRSPDAAIFLPESATFEGPFGTMEVDLEPVAELMDCGTAFVANDIPHFEEHSIELQLPFAARLFPDARLVPILVGRCGPSLARALSAGLRLVFGEDREESLFVVSSDLAFSADRETARRDSDRFLEQLFTGDREGLLAAAGRPGMPCGTCAAAALLASGLVERACLLGRHDAGRLREREDDRWGEYAALSFK
jgi:AmmeMemoRadiSam system protein B